MQSILWQGCNGKHGNVVGIQQAKGASKEDKRQLQKWYGFLIKMVEGMVMEKKTWKPLCIPHHDEDWPTRISTGHALAKCGLAKCQPEKRECNVKAGLFLSICCSGNIFYL
jgi:hypothetical protein